jgi:hypothetical protein
MKKKSLTMTPNGAETKGLRRNGKSRGYKKVTIRPHAIGYKQTRLEPTHSGAGSTY